METDPADGFRVYARFENKDNFVALRDEILAVDLYSEPSQDTSRVERQSFQKISNIVSPKLVLLGIADPVY